MSSKWLFPAAIVLSVILHLCLIFFLRFTFPLSEKKATSEPVEISIMPPEKKERFPEKLPELPPAAPVQPPPPPEEDPEETTLEHDLPGGRTAGEETGKKSPAVPAPKPPETPKPSPEIPKSFGDLPEARPDKTEPVEPAISEKDETALPGFEDIFNTKDITDRIANKKSESPKGEDTASYNTFEQKYASYFGKFRRRVYQLWAYPKSSVMRGETGVVGVTFSILKDGSVVNIRMTRSSGYPDLDREVMRVLKNIGKIPLPSSYELEQLNVDEANFIYTIGSGAERFIR